PTSTTSPSPATRTRVTTDRCSRSSSSCSPPPRRRSASRSCSVSTRASRRSTSRRRTGSGDDGRGLRRADPAAAALRRCPARGLSGFWHKELPNTTAGNKAFIVNRIGDFGFVLGMFLLFWTLDGRGHGTLVFRDLSVHAHLLEGARFWGVPVATLVTLFLFVGA